MYWLIQDNYVLDMLISFFARLLIKLMTGWTACVQFRHPLDVGGAYFTFTIFMSMAIGMVSVAVYDEEDTGRIDKATITTIMLGCCCGLVVFYTLFLLSIERACVSTFFDTRTGCQFLQDGHTIDRCKSEDVDQRKFMIVSYSATKWREDLGDKVKSFLAKRLPIWLDEQPGERGGKALHIPQTVLTA